MVQTWVECNYVQCNSCKWHRYDIYVGDNIKDVDIVHI